MNLREKKQSMLRRVTAVLLILCLLCNYQIPAMAETASTMKMQKTEGTVQVANSSGKQLSLIQNMSLYNGYQVATEAASYAWINLDDTKLTKLDEVSDMEIRSKGKELELLLNSGNLYFNVTAPLAADETLNIRTSSMVMGIRGTAGWVKVIDRWHTLVYILEGTLQCVVTDPVSGQSKSIVLHGGDMAEFVVYDNREKEGDKCDIFLRRFTEEEIDGFVLVELVQDEGLCRKIYEDSGLNILPLLDQAQDRLAADQAAMRQKLAQIQERVQHQANQISVDPVWGGGNTSESDSGSGGSSGTSNSTSPNLGPIVRLTMPVTAQQVQDVLHTDGVEQVILQPSGSGDPQENTLDVDVNVQVPAGETLTLEDGVDMETRAGTELQVDGTLDTAGDVRNNGRIEVNSSNTFRIEGILTNEPSGTIDNTASGRIVSPNHAVENNGTFTNMGKVEGEIRSSGTLELSGGEAQTVTQLGGNVEIAGGSLSSVQQSGGYAEVTGGIIADTYSVSGTGRLTVNGGELRTSSAGTAALRIDVDPESLDPASVTVNFQKGMIDGGESLGVELSCGTMRIGENGTLKAREVYNLMVIDRENFHAGLCDVAHFGDRYPSALPAGSSGGNEEFRNAQIAGGAAGFISPAGIFICKREDDGALSLAMMSDGVGEALAAARGGEIVTARQDDVITAPEAGVLAGEIYILQGNKTTPVYLDLNGKTLTLSDPLWVGTTAIPGDSGETLVGDTTGALEIYDSQTAPGILDVQDEIYLEAGSSLVAKNATYLCPTTFVRTEGDAFTEDLNELEIQDGAVIEMREDDEPFLLGNYGSLQIGTQGEPVTVRGTTGSSGAPFFALTGGQVVLDNVRMEAQGEDCTVLELSGKVHVQATNRTELVSEAVSGTVKYVFNTTYGDSQPSMEFDAGATVVNNSTASDHPALLYSLDDGYTWSDGLLSQVTHSGANIKAKNRDAVMWERNNGAERYSFSAGDGLGDAYIYDFTDSDGYYVLDTGGSDTLTLTMPVTVRQIQDALLGKERVILQAAESGDQQTNTLHVDMDWQIPEGKVLNLTDGVDVEIKEGAELQNFGKLFIKGNVNNSGSIETVSDYSDYIEDPDGDIIPMTFRVGGTLTNQQSGIVSNKAVGFYVSVFHNNGSFINDGQSEFHNVDNSGSIKNISSLFGDSDSSGFTFAVYENLTNQPSGTIDNKAARCHFIEFHNKGNFINEGKSGCTFTNSGTSILSKGDVYGVLQEGGVLTIQGGTLHFLDQSGGTVEITDGAISEISISQGEMSTFGGTIEKLGISIWDDDTHTQKIQGGKIGEIQLISGNMEIADGSVSTIEAMFGHVAMNGGIVENGCVLENEATLIMNDGVIQAGTSENALHIITGGYDSNSIVVDFQGGVIDGGVLLDYGNMVIGENAILKAEDTSNLLQINRANYDAGLCDIAHFGDRYGELDHSEDNRNQEFRAPLVARGPVAFLSPDTVFVCQEEGDGSLTLSGVCDSIGSALETAQAGEIVTVRESGQLVEPGEVISIKSGDSDHPVRLDLHGEAMEISGGLQIGFQNDETADQPFTGALEIYDSQESPGSLSVAETADYIGWLEMVDGSYLSLKNAAYTVYDIGCSIGEEGTYGYNYLEIQDGANLRLKDSGTPLLRDWSGRVTIGTEGAPVTIQGETSQTSETDAVAVFDLAYPGSETGNQIFLDDVTINASGDTAVLDLEGDIQVFITDRAKLISSSNRGTILYRFPGEGEEFQPVLELEPGAAIINDSEDGTRSPGHPAVFYADGYSDTPDPGQVSPGDTVSQMLLGKESIKAKNPNIIALGILTENDDALIEYSTADSGGLWGMETWDSTDGDGYYHLEEAKTQPATFSLAAGLSLLDAAKPGAAQISQKIPSPATPSQAEMIPDEDIQEEQEEEQGEADSREEENQVTFATPSQAERIFHDDLILDEDAVWDEDQSEDVDEEKPESRRVSGTSAIDAEDSIEEKRKAPISEEAEDPTGSKAEGYPAKEEAVLPEEKKREDQEESVLPEMDVRDQPEEKHRGKEEIPALPNGTQTSWENISLEESVPQTEGKEEAVK